MESVKERTAQPCHDMYSNMVTIIRVACRMSRDDICKDILVRNQLHIYVHGLCAWITNICGLMYNKLFCGSSKLMH